jgi:predicted amidophosphoribosyltransferase
MATGLLELLWPGRCPICERWLSCDDAAARPVGAIAGPLVHLGCLRSLPLAPGRPGSPRPLRDGAPVRWLYADAPALFALLHAAKYDGQPQLLRPLGRRLGAAARMWGWLPADCVLVPLPDDPVRLKQRGFSPTGWVAREVARAARRPVLPELLRRCRAAAPQARQRDDATRTANVAALFAPGRLSEVPRDLPLALVDDQITSGATMAAAARVLGSRGNPVICLALAGAGRAPGEVGLDTPAQRSLELVRRGSALNQSQTMR